jgi:hypothetical protein
MATPAPTTFDQEATSACDWIAKNSPYQRKRGSQRLCLYCDTAEASSKRDQAAHAAECLWRRVAAGAAAKPRERLDIARAFAAVRLERSGRDGSRECLVCGTAAPMHAPSCLLWRLHLRLLTEK